MGLIILSMANPADVQPKEKESRLSAFPLLLSCLFLSLFILSILFLTLFHRIRLGTERREYRDAHFNLVGMNKQWGFHVQDKFPLATHSHTLAQKHVLTHTCKEMHFHRSGYKHTGAHTG